MYKEKDYRSLKSNHFISLFLSLYYSVDTFPTEVKSFSMFSTHQSNSEGYHEFFKRFQQCTIHISRRKINNEQLFLYDNFLEFCNFDVVKRYTCVAIQTSGDIPNQLTNPKSIKEYWNHTAYQDISPFYLKLFVGLKFQTLCTVMLPHYQEHKFSKLISTTFVYNKFVANLRLFERLKILIQFYDFMFVPILNHQLSWCVKSNHEVHTIIFS